MLDRRCLRRPSHRLVSISQLSLGPCCNPYQRRRDVPLSGRRRGACSDVLVTAVTKRQDQKQVSANPQQEPSPNWGGCDRHFLWTARWGCDDKRILLELVCIRFAGRVLALVPFACDAAVIATAVTARLQV